MIRLTTLVSEPVALDKLKSYAALLNTFWAGPKPPVSGGSLKVDKAPQMVYKGKNGMRSFQTSADARAALGTTNLSDVEFVTSTGVKMVLPKDYLVVFVDETGNDISDSSYPVFGLGGCAVLARHYGTSLHKPWNELKRETCGEDFSLHACELLRLPNWKAIAERAAEFFKEQKSVYKVASVISSATKIDIRVGPRPQYAVAAGALWGNIVEVSKDIDFSGIWIVVESSNELNSSAKLYLPSILDLNEAFGKTFPLGISFATKSSKLLGLEVADFVMHAAGKAVQLNDRNRRDFVACFRNGSASFNEITRCYLNRIGPTARGKGTLERALFETGISL